MMFQSTSIFDDDWYEAHGIEVEKEDSQNGPCFVEMKRQRNEIVFGTPTPYTFNQSNLNKTPSKKSQFKMKGRDRNKPCPCGSGKKYKNCCGKLNAKFRYH